MLTPKGPSAELSAFDRWVIDSTNEGSAPVASGGAVLLGVAAGAAITASWWGWLLLLVMAGLMATAHVINRARSRDVKSELEARDAWLNQAASEHEEYVQALLSDQLWGCLWHIMRACGESDETERAKIVERARAAILECAVQIVGEGAARGTSANLYKMTYVRRAPVLVPEPGGSAGRGPASVRKFSLGDRTMEFTLQRKTQFVENYGGPEPYETYMTAPIYGEDQAIYGLLTVDCVRNGELREEVDFPRMELLAVMLAITYACELSHHHPAAPNRGDSPDGYDEVWGTA